MLIYGADLSTGPTSIIGLLTAEVVAEFTEEGYAPEVISAAVAFMMGVYCGILGFLKLGWVLDFISIPVLTGFVSAAALVILLGQVDTLLGLENVGDGTANIIHDVFATLGEANPVTVAIGFSSIVLLEGLAYCGRKWGKQNKVIWLLSICRAFITLVLYTGISYGVNKDRKEDPLFKLAKIEADGIVTPHPPDWALVQKVLGRSIAPFLAASLEHVAIGKAFGTKHGYVIDESQELCYLAVTNCLNSLFNSMGVGGAMSRTAVNSESGVKSPLSGILTTGFIVLSIYKLTGALYWIPKATLSAIIITAVMHLIGPISKFTNFWRVSFFDFAASMIAFWVTLFVSAEYGIGAGVAFSVAFSLVHTAFARVAVKSDDASHYETAVAPSHYDIPRNAKVFSFTEAIHFPNANRVKVSVVETVQRDHAPCATQQNEDRIWSVAAERRVKVLRRRAGIHPSQEMPHINVIVFDFTAVTYIDVTGVIAMKEMKAALLRFGGKDTLQLRFVGMNDSVRGAFRRGMWALVDWPSVGDSQPAAGADLHFKSVSAALADVDQQQWYQETYEEVIEKDGKV